LDTIDPAATAWLLASTALVLLMTPGLAIFYGGTVRTTGVLNIIMVRCECAYSFMVSDAPLWPINEAMTAGRSWRSLQARLGTPRACIRMAGRRRECCGCGGGVRRVSVGCSHTGGSSIDLPSPGCTE